MTKIKLCGLSRPCDIEAVNELKPEYIGFVFAPKSKRYISDERAELLKSMLSPEIQTVGVFVNEAVERVASLLNKGIIDIAQLHGNEDEAYISRLRELSDKEIIKAFKVKEEKDIEEALASSANYILLDSGAGSGELFDWSLLERIKRPYFLAGGLDKDNVSSAVRLLKPYAVDVSSKIESNGVKDREKMVAFTTAVRKEII